MKENPVVITGAAMVTALGLSVRETWDGLFCGRQGIRSIQGFDAEGFGCRAAAQVQGLDSTGIEIHSRSARIMDLHSHMLMRCASDAYLQARLDTAAVRPEDIGLFAGIGAVDLTIDDLLPAVLCSTDESGKFDMDRFWSRGHREIYPLVSLFMSNNISACQVAIRLNIRGENAVFSPQADSGAQAIAEGVNTLLEGRACAVLAGGVSEKVSPFSVARAHLKGVLNLEGESDGIQCRPFGARRQGTVLGEGCGIVSLELRAAADARGVPYQAMITGYGAAFEADQGSSPTSNAIARAMNEALESAELLASDIDVIILHGDGTPIGDRNEISAVHETFAANLDKIVGFSSKGALGHLSAGAPAVDIILGVCILTHGAIPVTVNAYPLDDNVKFQLTGKALKRSFKRLMVNCRSFEGHCGSLIIEALR